jgi:hypothetical protein
MTGQDFLSLAIALVGGTSEAEWRTASSRAYYAAFHVTRDNFQGLGFAVSRTDAAHNYLGHRLQNCGQPLLEQAGRDLDSLRSFRNQADYDLSLTFMALQGSRDIRIAQQLIQTLAVMLVEPTRTQVRDAIVAYERNVLRQVTWSPPPP